MLKPWRCERQPFLQIHRQVTTYPKKDPLICFQEKILTSFGVSNKLVMICFQRHQMKPYFICKELLPIKHTESHCHFSKMCGVYSMLGTIRFCATWLMTSAQLWFHLWVWYAISSKLKISLIAYTTSPW